MALRKQNPNLKKKMNQDDKCSRRGGKTLISPTNKRSCIRCGSIWWLAVYLRQAIEEKEKQPEPDEPR